jgi:hypothetical protein
MLLFADIMDVVVSKPMGNQSIGLIDNWIRHIKDVSTRTLFKYFRR